MDDRDKILEDLLLEFGSDAPEEEAALTEPVRKSATRLIAITPANTAAVKATNFFLFIMSPYTLRNLRMEDQLPITPTNKPAPAHSAIIGTCS